MPTAKLSNLFLTTVIGLLGIGILLDGTLYNKAPTHPAIHQIGEPQAVSAFINNQPLVTLERVGNIWHQTYPIAAPAQSLRVQPLLDTNKYSQRSYRLEDLPHEEIFADPVTLKINDTEYLLCTVEPVSKLRYVRSGDQVFLQPDTILPMLAAAETVFVDLNITGKVDRLTIGDTVLEQPAVWTDLKALRIVDTNRTDNANNSIEIRVTEDDQIRVLSASLSEIGYTITKDQKFTYLIPDTTAEKLGLVDLLADS